MVDAINRLLDADSKLSIYALISVRILSRDIKRVNVSTASLMFLLSVLCILHIVSMHFMIGCMGDRAIIHPPV